MSRFFYGLIYLVACAQSFLSFITFQKSVDTNANISMRNSNLSKNDGYDQLKVIEDKSITENIASKGDTDDSDNSNMSNPLISEDQLSKNKNLNVETEQSKKEDVDYNENYQIDSLECQENDKNKQLMKYSLVYKPEESKQEILVDFIVDENLNETNSNESNSIQETKIIQEIIGKNNKKEEIDNANEENLDSMTILENSFEIIPSNFFIPSERNKKYQFHVQIKVPKVFFFFFEFLKIIGQNDENLIKIAKEDLNTILEGFSIVEYKDCAGYYSNLDLFNDTESVSYRLNLQFSSKMKENIETIQKFVNEFRNIYNNPSCKPILNKIDTFFPQIQFVHSVFLAISNKISNRFEIQQNKLI
ncbi:hypothetical protein GVAV_001726 [Gurleya vavrai]